VGSLKSEICSLKGNLRGSTGKITMLKFQLEKSRKEVKSTAAIENTMAASLPTNKSSPNKSDWIMHWKKSRPIVRSLSSALESDEATLYGETITDAGALAAASASDARTDCSPAKEIELHNLIVGSSEQPSLQHRLAVQERFNERLVIQMRTWVDSQIAMHRQLAEADVAAAIATISTTNSPLQVSSKESPAEDTKQPPSSVQETATEATSEKVATGSKPGSSIEKKLLSPNTSADTLPIGMTKPQSPLLQPAANRTTSPKTPASLMSYLKAQMKLTTTGPRYHSISEEDCELINDDEVEVFDIKEGSCRMDWSLTDRQVLSEFLRRKDTAEERITSYAVRQGSTKEISNVETEHQNLDFSDCAKSYVVLSHVDDSHTGLHPPQEPVTSRAMNPKPVRVDTCRSSKYNTLSYADDSSAHGGHVTKTLLRNLSSSLPTCTDLSAPATPNTVRNAWSYYKTHIEDAPAISSATMTAQQQYSSQQRVGEKLCTFGQLPTIYEASEGAAIASRTSGSHLHANGSNNRSSSNYDGRDCIHNGGYAQPHGSVNELSPASFKDHLGRFRQNNSQVQDSIARIRDTLQVGAYHC
jgi:hypothetical protein